MYEKNNELKKNEDVQFEDDLRRSLYMASIISHAVRSAVPPLDPKHRCPLLVAANDLCRVVLQVLTVRKDSVEHSPILDTYLRESIANKFVRLDGVAVVIGVAGNNCRRSFRLGGLA